MKLRNIKKSRYVVFKTESEMLESKHFDSLKYEYDHKKNSRLIFFKDNSEYEGYSQFKHEWMTGQLIDTAIIGKTIFDNESTVTITSDNEVYYVSRHCLRKPTDKELLSFLFRKYYGDDDMFEE